MCPYATNRIKRCCTSVEIGNFSQGSGSRQLHKRLQVLPSNMIDVLRNRSTQGFFPSKYILHQHPYWLHNHQRSVIHQHTFADSLALNRVSNACYLRSMCKAESPGKSAAFLQSLPVIILSFHVCSIPDGQAFLSFQEAHPNLKIL